VPAAATSARGLGVAVGLIAGVVFGLAGSGLPIAAPASAAPKTPTGMWRPYGALLDVVVVPDCDKTAGAAAIADPERRIYYCPTRVDYINRRAPGAGHFFFVHEFGHIALDSGDEREVDCWAAREFRKVADGAYYIEAAARFFMRFPRPDDKYGSGKERALRLRRCYADGGPAYP